MSILAGIFYFDRRPISAADEAQVRRALGDFDRQPMHCFRSPGLIMGVAGSPPVLPKMMISPDRLTGASAPGMAVWITKRIYGLS